MKSIKQTADVFVRISTNASRTLSYWNDKTELFDEITISVHNEFADLDHIIKVADLIYSKRRSNLYVFVLMDPFNWDKSVQCLDYLMANSKEWFLSPQPVLFNNVTVYNDEQKAYLQTVSNRECKDVKRLDPNYTMVFYDDTTVERYDYKKIVLNNLNNFYGYNCNLGIDRLYINIQGNVRGACGEILFGGDLNIKDLDFEKKLSAHKELKPVICKQSTCGCGAEIILDKELI